MSVAAAGAAPAEGETPADAAAPARGDHALEPVAVIGAMSAEVERLRAALSAAADLSAGPFKVHSGRLEGVDVLLAECGVGKVNAAALTQLLIDRGARSVVFTGVAGALDPRLRVGDVVVSSDAVQHDVDVTALDYLPGEVPGSGTFFEADARLVDLALSAAATLPGAATYLGRIASGDSFVASAAAADGLRRRFEALCAEMEGAACAQVCRGWGVPFVIVRSISDSADRAAHTDFRAFTALAAANAETITRGVLRGLVTSA